MTKALLAVVLAAAVLLVPGRAEAGPFLVRVRGVYIVPADKSEAIPALSVAEDDITVSKKLIPEVDFTYFITPHLAAELILTYPQKHDVEVAGTKIGTFSHLPPVLAVQWHFLPDALVSPYVGLGVNLTLITSTDLEVPGVGKLDLTSPSVGVAGQVGADVRITPQVFLNVDVKYVTLRTDVEAGGNKVSTVKVDPWLVGVGVGYRF